MSEIMKFKNLKKIYQMGEVKVEALRGVTMDIQEGEFVVILGPSGSGKSTLLNILGGMDLPTEGDVSFRNQMISNYNDRKLTEYRRSQVGFVFQFYNLMANLTAKENVELATEISVQPLDIDQVFNRRRIRRAVRSLPGPNEWWRTATCCHCKSHC